MHAVVVRILHVLQQHTTISHTVHVRRANSDTTPWSVIIARFSSSLSAMAAMARQAPASACRLSDLSKLTSSSRAPTRDRTSSDESFTRKHTQTYPTTQAKIRHTLSPWIGRSVAPPSGRALRADGKKSSSFSTCTRITFTSHAHVGVNCIAPCVLMHSGMHITN
jgi:hypothetical protein